MSNRKFEMYEIRQILVRMRQGDSDRSLSKSGLVGRRKAAMIRKLADQHGWLDEGVALPSNGVLHKILIGEADSPVHSQSSVEPYRNQVQTWVDQGIQSTTIHAALVRQYQYKGSYSSVHRFVREIKQSIPQATCVLNFDPGEAAQIDFGSGPKILDTRTGELRKTWFFLMTLAFSRHQYAELVWDQKIATWLECHRHAFDYLGGVVRRLIIDNAKCAITKACYHDPVVQRAYGEYAEGYGFKIDALPPREPQMKGRVESGIKYLKRNFLPIREFVDIHDANRQLQQWTLGYAGNRIHGSTRQAPLALFALEKDQLLPLPDNPPELAVWAKVKVHRDAHVQFEHCLYSVPHTLMGQSLWLRASPLMIRIYQQEQLIATHNRLFIKGSRQTLDDHLPPNALAYKMRNPTWCRQQAERIGPACHTLIEHLFADRVMHNLRAAQGIVSLEKQYGKQRLNAACQRALDFHNPRYRTVKSILEKGLDCQQNPNQAFDSLADCYTGQGRYSRDITHLLKH